MNPIRPEATRLRLDRAAYETLRQQVLRRDGWRCQSCGAIANLEVHHKKSRSQCGDDSELNLITLCSACHTRRHLSHSTPTSVGDGKGLQGQVQELGG
jgi:5-methylcytosine-specific restriction endonuclease McrA